MRLVRSILCRLGRHHRSRAEAYNDGEGWVSVCRYCEAPMRRIAPGRWKRIARLPPDPDTGG